MNPVIDLEKIDWNSMTDAKSVFESILDALKSSDRENVEMRKENAEMRKEIKRLAKETEAFSKEREALAEMDEKIEMLAEENNQLREEDDQLREENESLRAENAALLRGGGATEAVMDRIARLEKAVADSNAQLGDARAANSALAAENLGIKSKSKRNRYGSDVKPPNPYGTVTARRPREDPPVSVRMTADQTRCIHGHPLSEPTETVT